jgi:UDP-MurNAc hydroxylase
MQSAIRLINHASVKFEFDDVKILTDPWYEGSVFHKGWKLIHQQTHEEILNSILDVTHIYISHEHPDHFSPNFFLNKEISKILINNNVKILFQETKDKRVIKFLEKKGYTVIEVLNNKFFYINKDVKIKIIKFGYIDSSLIIETKDKKILNLNDCPLNKEDEIKKFKNKHGEFDILLSQFSYAAWKGGKENSNYRKLAAKDKITTLIKQYEILNCNCVIPFASFIYFSNKLNNYMNDYINQPKKFYEEIKDKVNIVIMSPNERQNLSNLKQNLTSLDIWDKKYKQIDNYPDDRIQNFLKNNEIKYINTAKKLRFEALQNNTYFHGFENTKLGTGHWNKAGHDKASKIISTEMCKFYN